MESYDLVNTDSEDIEDLLLKVEDSFDIKFIGDELVHIKTFGELCDHITNKIQLVHSNDCTSQQAFYKLRNAIRITLKVEEYIITTETLLSDILPRHSRVSRTRKLEKNLGFKLSIIRPPHFITISLGLILIISFIGLFIKWEIGLTGLVFSLIGLWLAKKFGKEMDLKTVGEVSEKMTRESYLKSRRNSKTFNKEEIEKVLTDWFSIDLSLDKSKLSRASKF